MAARGMVAVTGPVTGGRHGWPFGGPFVDLARYGYREEEYFLEGAAARYVPVTGSDLGWDGHWQLGPAEPAPYRTRLVVVRPEDPDRFDGTVVVFWNNVSAAHDAFGGGDSVVGPDRPRTPVDPMGGLEVRQLLAQGASQSAGRLATYVNAVQPLAGVLDGFLLTFSFGSGSPLEVGDAVMVLSSLDTASGGPPRALAGTHLLRGDLDVPVMW